MDTLRYDAFIDALSARVQAFPPRSRAAVFWLAGTALRVGLSEPGAARWTAWMNEASELSVDFIVDGRSEGRLRNVWEAAGAPFGTDASQLLNSVIICLSSPLAIAIEPRKVVGSWIEHALFPVIQLVSLDHYGDVAFPSDEGLEEVFAHGRVEAACDYLVSICACLEANSELDRTALGNLLQGSGVLRGAGVP